MSSFQIHDASGQAISINNLDKEACELWGTEVHKKDYASPSDIPEIKARYFTEHNPEEHRKPLLDECKFWMERQNWFDWIGWKIAQGNTSWEGLREEILTPYRKHGEGMMEYIKTDPRIWGFIDLINLWEHKGYTPVQLNSDYHIISKNGNER